MAWTLISLSWRTNKYKSIPTTMKKDTALIERGVAYISLDNNWIYIEEK
jgi:hypothetical protein